MRYSKVLAQNSAFYEVIPVITNDQAKALYSVCIENLLLAYGVKKENISSFIPLANYIYSVIPDLRQLILTCILMIIIIPEISKGSTATARKYVQKPLNPT